MTGVLTWLGQLHCAVNTNEAFLSFCMATWEELGLLNLSPGLYFTSEAYGFQGPGEEQVINRQNAHIKGHNYDKMQFMGETYHIYLTQIRQ